MVCALSAAQKLAPANFSDLLTTTQRFTAAQCLAAVIVTLLGSLLTRTTNGLSGWSTPKVHSEQVDRVSFFPFSSSLITILPPAAQDFPKAAALRPGELRIRQLRWRNQDLLSALPQKGPHLGSVASAIHLDQQRARSRAAPGHPTRHAATPSWRHPALQFPWLSLAV
jgi:hypothetical protein